MNFASKFANQPTSPEEALSRPRIAVILPAYNEELTIARTIADFNDVIPDAAIWVINNRSSDRTEEIARESLAACRNSGGVIYEGRPGKGNAVRRAFHDVDADIYILADADLTYPAHHVPDLIAPVVRGEADMVVGDRHSEGHYASENKRAFHGFGNNLVKYLVNKLFRSRLADIMSGYRVFNRKFVKTYPILVDGFEIETDMTLHALDKRFRICEIPVNYRDRPEGSASKLNTISDGLRVLSTICNIMRHYRPLTFFGLTAVVAGLVGLVAAIPVFDDWFTSRYIYHVPLAIFATGMEIAAMLMASVGLILDSLAHQDKRNFEREILAMTNARK